VASYLSCPEWELGHASGGRDKRNVRTETQAAKKHRRKEMNGICSPISNAARPYAPPNKR